MAKKKKSVKKETFDPMEGYISVFDPIVPTIRKDQFGNEIVITEPNNLPSQQNISFSPKKSFLGNIRVLSAASPSNQLVTSIEANSYFMITYIHIICEYTAAVAEGTRALVYLSAVSGGTTPLIAAYVDRTATTVLSQTTMAPTVPLAIDSDIYNAIRFSTEAAGVGAQLFLYGYSVRKS